MYFCCCCNKSLSLFCLASKRSYSTFWFSSVCKGVTTQQRRFNHAISIQFRSVIITNSFHNLIVLGDVINFLIGLVNKLFMTAKLHRFKLAITFLCIQNTCILSSDTNRGFKYMRNQLVSQNTQEIYIFNEKDSGSRALIMMKVISVSFFPSKEKKSQKI